VSYLGDRAILLMGYSPADHPEVSSTLNTLTLEEAIAHSRISKRWAVDCQYVADGSIAIAKAIRMGTVIVVSDGSFKDMFGTAALVMEGSDSAHHILAVNVTPGDADDQSSYHSELSRIFGVVT